MTSYARIPITAFMRNGPNPAKPTCNLLIYQTIISNVPSYAIVLGDAFLQQYFAEFRFNPNSSLSSNNTMTLTVTNNSLPGTYIGNATFDYVVPEPTPLPVPEPDIVQPVPPVPSENRTQFTNFELGIICGGAGIVFLMIVLVMLCCKRAPV